MKEEQHLHPNISVRFDLVRLKVTAENIGGECSGYTGGSENHSHDSVTGHSVTQKRWRDGDPLSGFAKLHEASEINTPHKTNRNQYQ